MLVTVRCFDRDIMPLYCRQSHLKALQWWTDVSLWMDATVPVLKMDITLPTVYFSVSLLFAWKQWLLLLISFILHPSLRELEMTNRRYHWEDADTAGPSKRPPPDGPDRLLKRSLRPAAHLQWLSRSCRRLIDNDQYGGTEQNKMKINIRVSLTGLGLRRDEFCSQVLVLRHPWARHLFYFNHFTCFGQPTKVALHNNLWSDTRGPNLIP